VLAVSSYKEDMINENIKEVSVKPIQFPHKRPLNSFPEPSGLTFRKPKSLKDVLALRRLHVKQELEIQKVLE
jgi:hypothetical protein